jgi:hypothetical protein
MTSCKKSSWAAGTILMVVVLCCLLATAWSHQRGSEPRIVQPEIGTPISNRPAPFAVCMLMEPGRRQVVRPLPICPFGHAAGIPAFSP